MHRPAPWPEGSPVHNQHQVRYELTAVLVCTTCEGSGTLMGTSTCPACMGEGKTKRQVSLQEALAAVLTPPAPL